MYFDVLTSRLARIGFVFFVGSVTVAAQPARVLQEPVVHLRSGDKPEWDLFANQTPEGARFDLRFQGERNIGPSSLFIYQDDVKLDWRIELNGQRLGSLFLMEAPLVKALEIREGRLVDGENRLSLIPPSGNDDIVAGPFEIDSRPLSDVLSETTLEIFVKQTDNGQGIPCRITVLDRKGALAALKAFTGQNLAVRPGVIYTANGSARLGVRAGDYTVYATRGVEYGLAKRKVSVKRGESRSIILEINREVPTPGFVSSDTHIHTFTFSRHGDATVEERVVTLAGEGIELPIATDHEHLTDLTGAAAAMGVDTFFTPVIGCETTTAKGHFNSFPRPVGSVVPNHRETDWPRLMESIRSTPEVRVVVLNHPRNIHNGFQPFARTNFNAITGENYRGKEFNFDAIEVLNSSALQSDLMIGFRDWFALLNYGYRVTAVGSSDVHDVSRYIVGQGRTYIECADASPSEIDIESACKAIRNGRALVSMGLITNIRVNGEFGVGDVAGIDGDSMRVEVIVMGPSWIDADRVQLFANGLLIRDEKIERGTPKASDKPGTYDPIKARIEWVIPRAKHDAHLVAIASGPAVSEPYWAIPRPYQPSSSAWNPRVIGATNPVWVDADGDGRFTAAREYARAIVEQFESRLLDVIPALDGFDSMIAAQAASLCHVGPDDLRSKPVSAALAAASEAVRLGFDLYAGTVSGRAILDRK